MNNIKYLLENSNLPGPRGNLKLLYQFSKTATNDEIDQCLEYITPNVKNSPEEFVGMCGVLSYAIKNKENLKKIIPFLKKHSVHSSWRIRESVAIAIQEISEDNLENIINELRPFILGNSLEKRAVVAGFCEPKLLKNNEINIEILNILFEITKSLSHNKKLDEENRSLKKALGYGWSVVISKTPTKGKLIFEKMFDLDGKHIKWIMKENLKKNRLKKIDPEWVDLCLNKLTH